MGTKYTTTSISGFNASPPVNNGTISAANQLDWDKHISKIGTPLKDLAESMNTKLVTALDKSARAVTANASAAASDHDKIIEIGSTASPAVTITLADAATMTTNYVVTVVNRSAYAATIARSGSDTINGAASASIVAGGAGIFAVNAAANGYLANINLPSAGGTITGDLIVAGGLTASSGLNTTTVTASGAISGATVAGAMVATQAQQETGTATNVLVTPGRQHFHASAAKFWVKADTAGGVNSGYNITSVTDVGAGEITVTIATDLSDDQYVVVGTPLENSFAIRHINISSVSAGSFSARCGDSNNTASDPTNWFFVGYGDI